MADPKLNEIIAITTGRKGQVLKHLTEIYHKFQREGLFDGLSRTYKPRQEEGEQFPSEKKQPQLRVSDLLNDACRELGEFLDLTLTLDVGNAKATADIEVGNEALLKDVPVTTLLFLEKQILEVITLISKIPTPDPAETWTHDANQDMLATSPAMTAKTKKVKKVIVKYEATEEHPAQTELIDEDVVVGDWTQILYTTRMAAAVKRDMMQRARQLLDAIKIAREKANSKEVEKQKMSNSLLKYVFGEYYRQ